MEVLRKISAYLIYSSSLSPDKIAQFETKEKAEIEKGRVKNQRTCAIQDRLAILEFLDFFGG